MFNKQDFNGALNITSEMRGLGDHPYVSYMVSPLMIDIGSCTNNDDLIKQGVEILEKDFKILIEDVNLAPYAYYNLANGFCVLHNIKRMKNSLVGYFNDNDLTKAIEFYLKALEFNIDNDHFISQIWTNLGNCFDTQGRVIDALECYENAINFDPKHGVALGNMGIAYIYYAELVDQYHEMFLSEAYSHIRTALDLGTPHEAQVRFLYYLKDIKRRVQDASILNNPPESQGYKIDGKSRFEKYLKEYCLKNKLYLNICSFCQKCEAAIGDTVTIKTMITSTKSIKKEESRFFRFASYLNQIKQDYITARFLLIQSRYEGLDLSFVDERVKIVDTLDGSIHNIYVQLAKAAFKGFFDILDKIANFANDYLDFGIPEHRVSFKSIWDLKNEKICNKIMEIKNFSLNALYEIHKEIEKGRYETLRKTRNALTHRFVNIYAVPSTEDEENMSIDTFINHTVELAKIVRSSIIYLLNFVHLEESKLKEKMGEKLNQISSLEFPDGLKSIR